MTNGVFILKIKHDFDKIVRPVMLSLLFKIEYQDMFQELETAEEYNSLTEIPVSKFSKLSPE